MPLMMLKVSVPVAADRRKKLLSGASRLLAEATGKPEAYVMVTIEQCEGCFDGKEGPLAFADVRGIGGFTKEVNTAISRGLCALLQAELAIPQQRVYSVFTNVVASAWGWNGGLFG